MRDYGSEFTDDAQYSLYDLTEEQTGGPEEIVPPEQAGSLIGTEDSQSDMSIDYSSSEPPIAVRAMGVEYGAVSYGAVDAWAPPVPVSVRERIAPEAAAPLASPRHIFEETVQHTGFEEWFAGEMRARRCRPLAAETPPSVKEEIFFEEVNEAILTIGRELHFDMTDRLQLLAEHHLFDTEAQYMDGITERLGARVAQQYAGTFGFSEPSAGIFWTRSGDAPWDTYGLTHEKIHGVSLQKVYAGPVTRVTSNGHTATQYRIRGYSTGYADLRKGSLSQQCALTELVTDMAADKALTLAGYRPIPPNYGRIDILGAGVVLRVARSQGMTPQAVESGLIKGLWTPDRSGLQPVREVIGDAGLQSLIDADVGMDYSAARDLAEELHLARPTIAALNAHESGYHVDFFEWRNRSGAHRNPNL